MKNTHFSKKNKKKHISYFTPKFFYNYRNLQCQVVIFNKVQSFYVVEYGHTLITQLFHKTV